MDSRSSHRSQSANAALSAWRALPGGIWAMGLGSLFMDASSELIHSLLPIFMVSALGASIVTIALIEGVAEATAAIVRVFSGAASDYLRRRKLLVVFGYALGAVTKPIFPLADSVQWVFAARFLDRVGKGIRGAPRDALVADLTPPQLRGAAYGLRQALDSVGAVAGPLLAVALLSLFADDIRTAMWFGTVPAFISVTLLLVYVRDPERSHAIGRSTLSLADAKRLPLRYWLLVLLGGVFTMARFSEAFLVLRAQDVGLGLRYVPIVMIVMNGVYAGIAYPAGAAADRIRPRTLMFFGLLVLLLADVTLALAASPQVVFAGAALWGLHMAFTQGLLSKLVADTSPPELFGTGFGLFNLVTGVALILANVIAGSLWNAFGASATFWAGALFAAVAAIGITAAGKVSAK